MTREEAKDYIREWCPYDKHDEIIKALEQEPRWIPIKTRPMDAEEKEYYRQFIDDYVDETEMFDCQMPEDGQEVLITHNGYVSVDTYETDCDGCYFECYDIGDVTAWMPLPKPYKVNCGADMRSSKDD